MTCDGPCCTRDTNTFERKFFGIKFPAKKKEIAVFCYVFRKQEMVL